MKSKKSKKANVENFRAVFFQVGLILVLSAILAAFEWKSKVDYTPMTYSNSGDEIIEFNAPIIRFKEEKKMTKPLVPVNRLKIEKNDVVIKDEILVENYETAWDDPVINFERTEEPDDLTEHITVEIMPTFMGQNAAYFRNFIVENIKFPNAAIENEVRGRVFVSFVVEKDGSINKIEIIRGVHPAIDKAVIDVIKSSPKWEPGLQSGRFVKVKFSIAVDFDLI